MANYYAKTRTNYFSVTDAEKFKQIIALCKASDDDIYIIESEQENGGIKYGFYCEGSIDGLPEKDDGDDTEYCDDDDFDYNYDAFCEALQPILPDDDAVLITEIGSEKMRYLTGQCSVITRNSCKCLDLSHEAVKLAATMLSNPDFTTQMEY